MCGGEGEKSETSREKMECGKGGERKRSRARECGGKGGGRPENMMLRSRLCEGDPSGEVRSKNRVLQNLIRRSKVS